MKALILATGVAALVAGSAFAEDWKLGVQAYSFRKFTFADTLDQLSEMGVKYVEMYPGQTIGGGLEGKTHHNMDAATREAIQKMLAEKGVQVLSYGVVYAKDEDEWRQAFDFAKAMGIGMINAEPKDEHYDLLVKLAAEYGIPVGIHNHATPSKYWDPQVVLGVIKDRPGLYAAPDNGHWARSGIASVDGFKLLEGRMKSIHIKDMKVFDQVKGNECVPFGTGVCELDKAIAELKRQKYDGPFIIEYESNPDNPAPEIKQCVAWFNQNARK